MTMRRFLVTGAAGFLGSHLCRLLIRRGYSVCGIDNRFSATPDSLLDLENCPEFSLIECDVSRPFDPPGQVDGIFHLATPADPERFRTHPVETARSAAVGAAVMLEIAHRLGCRFLLASSDAVYGDVAESPQRETTIGALDPVGPRSAYDEGKRFAESLTMAYHRQFALNGAIARIFHTYGEGMPWDGRLMPTYILRALRGEPLMVMGSGQQTRAYCYVSDMVEGILALFLSDYHGPMNIGNPNQISVLELARLIAGLAGGRSTIEFAPALESDRRSRCPDISLANELLSWSPRVSLEDGLRRTIECAASEDRGEWQAVDR
jgi:dTDP-glucose 4,6-dehydratase